MKAIVSTKYGLMYIQISETIFIFFLFEVIQNILKYKLLIANLVESGNAVSW